MIASFRRALRGAAHWVTVALVAMLAGAAGAVVVLVARPAGSPAPAAGPTGQSTPPAVAGRPEPASAQPASAQPASAQPSSAQPSSAQPSSAQPSSAEPAEWPGVAELTSVTNSADGYRLSQPEAAATAVPVGGLVTMHGDTPGERVEISVVRVTDPFVYPAWPPLGDDRWVAVKVHVHNTGTVRFIAYPEKDALAIDTQGRWFHYSGPMTAARGFQRLRIAPNFDADGVIVFELPKTAELAHIRLTLRAGTPTRTADWKL